MTLTSLAKPALYWLAALGCWLHLGVATAWAAEETTYFQVRSAETRLVDGVYRLDARIDLQLSPAVREALVNGVPLVIEIQMEVQEPREWLWSKTLASLIQRYELDYHALSERYVVRNLNTGSRQSYPSLGEAFYQLGWIRDFPLIDAGLLPADHNCRGAIRAALSIESLPTPIRLMAYTNSQWWLGSDWLSWPLRP